MKLKQESPREIFGPYLFLIYINDLSIALKAILTLFADDTTSTVFGKTTHEVLEKAEIHLEALIKWTKYNQLILNPSKSSFFNYSQL